MDNANPAPLFSCPPGELAELPNFEDFGGAFQSHMVYQYTPELVQGPTKQARRMTKQEKAAHTKERNRIHARNSRLRKRLYVDTLKQQIATLQHENQQLRMQLEALGSQGFDGFGSPWEGDSLDNVQLLADEGAKSQETLSKTDYVLVEALSNSTQNFVISDPKLPDNPIIFASQRFYNLTGYSREEVIGRNCRFLQGPETDPREIAKIREAVANGTDVQVVVKNYRKNGEMFWNRLFIAPLRNVGDNIVNFIAVQSEISAETAKKIAEVEKQQAERAKEQAESAKEQASVQANPGEPGTAA